jgi:hypothetical protein
MSMRGGRGNTEVLRLRLRMTAAESGRWRALLRFEGEEHGVVEGLEGGEVGLGGDEEEVGGGAVGAWEGDEPVVFAKWGATVRDG